MPHKKRAAPSARELEKALLHILRRNHFTGPEEVSVLVVGSGPTPIYLVTLGSAAAALLRDLLVGVLGKRTQPSFTELVLFRTDAEAILEAARAA